MKKLYALMFFVTLILLSACKDDPSSPIVPVPPAVNGILIINEGLYGQNNSTITLYNIETNQSTNNAFQNANQGSKLGDTANDLFIKDGVAYIAVDNSNKIEIIDTETLISKGFINLGSNQHPRKIVIVDSTLGYATSLSDKVLVFNPKTLSLLNEVPTGSKPEGISINNNKLYIANSGFGIGNSVSVINTNSNTVIKEIPVGLNPRNILSKDNFIYVICSGKFDATGEGWIYKIETSFDTVVDSLKINKNPGEACIAENDLLVVNSDGVNEINLSTFTLNPNLLITSSDVNSSNSIIYSISYDNHNKYIYCGNPKDYQQNGEVVIYDLTGNEIRRIGCGLNPGSIKNLN